MANPECRWECPQQWSAWSEWLAAGLHARNRWRLPVLLMGILFANGRRTVTSWLRAAGISDDFQDYYYFLEPVGRKSKSNATQFTQAHFTKRIIEHHRSLVVTPKNHPTHQKPYDPGLLT